MSLPPAEQPKPVATRADRDRERHARKIARAALEQLGFPTSRLRLLHDGQNTTYRVDAPDGPHALRVTRPGVGLPHVEGELAWTAALDRDTTLTLCAPQAWTTVQERVCVMTRWVPGVSRTKSLSASMLRAVGAVMAELHEHGHGWRPPPGWARPRLETVWLEAPSPLPLLPSPARETFARCEQRLRPVLARLFDEPTHVLHADLHQGNYRFRPGHRVGVIDFDSCAVGHPAQDIAICLYYVLRHPRYARLRPAFEEGYRSRRPWPTDDRTLDALWVWRSLGLCAGVHAHPSEKLRNLIPALLPRWHARAQRWLDQAPGH